MKTLIRHMMASGAICVAGLFPQAEALDLRVSSLKSHLRPGEATQLLVTLANNGSSTETSVSVDFEMPAGFTGNTLYAYPPVARGVTTLDPGETVGWDIAQLLPGQIVQHMISVTPLTGGSALPDGAAVDFTFVVSIDNVQDDTFTRSLTVDASHNLDAGLSLETAGAVPGVPFEVTIAYGNRGATPQTGVGLSLDLPPGTTLVDASATPTQVGDNLFWSRGTVGPGEVGQVLLRLQLSATSGPGELRDLLLGVSSGTQNQGAQAVLTPGTAGDLQLSLAHSALPLPVSGTTVQTTATLTNSRSFSSSDLELRFLMPARLSGNTLWTDETPAAGVTTLSGGEVVGWNFVSLQAMDSLQSRMDFLPGAGGVAGSVIPQAWIVSDSSGAQAVALIAFPISGDSGVNLELSAPDSGLEAGEDFQMVLTVANDSASIVSNIQARVTLPAAYFQDLKFSGGSASISGDVVTFAPVSLNAGSATDRVITGRVASTVTKSTIASASLARRLSAIATLPSPAQASSLATLTQTVRDEEPLDLEISADRRFLSDNESCRVLLTVTNRGNATLTNLVLDTLLPEYVTGNTATTLPSPNRGVTTLSPIEQVGWNVSSLAPGASRTFELLLFANSPTIDCSVIALKARVRDSSFSLLDDAQLNLAIVQNTLPELLLACDRMPADAGETVRFTVSYGNPTSSPMNSAALEVRLPRGLEFLFSESGLAHTPDPVFPSEGGGSVVVFTGVSLPPHSLGEAVFYARPMPGTAAGTQLPVRASLKNSGLEASSVLDLPISPLSQLKLAISQDGLPLTDNSKAEYVFAVTNEANYDLSNVVVRFLFPVFSAGDTAQTSPVASIGVTSLAGVEDTGWQIPLLAAGTTRFFRCQVSESSATDGQLANMIVHADAADGSQSLALSAVTYDSAAGLDLTLTAGPHAVLPGGTTHVEMAIGNRSNTVISSGVVRVDLPGNLLEVVGPPGAPPLVGNTLLWNRPTMAPGEISVMPFSVKWRPGVPVGSLAEISARAISSSEIATASLVLATSPAAQAELVPSLAADDTTLTNGQTVMLSLQADNSSVSQRNNIIVDFFVPRGFTGNSVNATPPLNFGITTLSYLERVGWSFATYSAGQNTLLQQPMTFTVGSNTPAGSVIPLSAGVYDDSLGHNLSSIAFFSNPAASVSLIAIDPVGIDPTDLDNDGIPDIYETGSGLFVSEFDTGTSPSDPDSDNDGILDGKELESGFFDPTRDDSFIVSFFEERTSDLAFGTPVLTRDQTTGKVGLKISLRESSDLGGFTKRNIAPGEATVIGGDILLDLESPGNAYFFRFGGSATGP